jgi:malonate transporter and related proteins
VELALYVEINLFAAESLMNPVVEALFPLFALILLGYILRSTMLRDLHFWSGVNKLSYYVLLPALLVQQLAGATFNARLLTTLWGVVISAMLVVTVVVWLTRRWTTASNGAFTSVLQGAIRPNTYLALALAATLFGQAGVAYTAVTLAATVPLVNLLSVTALVYYRGDDAAHAPRRGREELGLVVRSVVQNPLIAACLAGLGLNLSGLGALADFSHLLSALAQASLPMGLLTVGAGLDLATLRTALRPLVSATFIKLILSPAIALFFCRLFDLNSLLTGVCAIFMALPCAAASYVLAERMGGDFRLMAGILTVETVASGITLPLLLFWLL